MGWQCHKLMTTWRDINFPIQRLMISTWDFIINIFHGALISWAPLGMWNFSVEDFSTLTIFTLII